MPSVDCQTFLLRKRTILQFCDWLALLRKPFSEIVGSVYMLHVAHAKVCRLQPMRSFVTCQRPLSILTSKLVQIDILHCVRLHATMAWYFTCLKFMKLSRRVTYSAYMKYWKGRSQGKVWCHKQHLLCPWRPHRWCSLLDKNTSSDSFLCNIAINERWNRNIQYNYLCQFAISNITKYSVLSKNVVSMSFDCVKFCNERVMV